MGKIVEITKNTIEENQEKVDWTKAWSTKYPVLKRYQSEVNVQEYTKEIRRMFASLQNDSFFVQYHKICPE